MFLTNLGAKIIQYGREGTENIPVGSSTIHTITFPKPFSTQPIVVASIGCWHSDPEQSHNKNDREYISVSRATEKDVKLKWTNVSETTTNGRYIHWIAIGE